MAVRDEAMPRSPRPFDAAFLAIALAVGLPVVIGMFGAIRSRQLQSTANPRWAQFARGTAKSLGSSEKRGASEHSMPPSEVPSGPRAIRIASHPVSDQPYATFTGTVTDGDSFTTAAEFPLVKMGIPESADAEDADNADLPATDLTATEEMPTIVLQPVDEDRHESAATQLIGRLESQLQDVQQRLDRLSTHQQQQQEAESLREEQFLAKLKRLYDESVKEKTHQGPLAAPELPIPSQPGDSVYEPEISLEVEESPRKKEHFGAPQTSVDETVTPAPLPADLPEPEESAIRIRKSTGNSVAETFTIDIQDADIRQVFAQLSEAAEISIVPSPEIEGRVSLNLHEVRIEQALNALIHSRDYSIEREGEILIIRSANEAVRKRVQNRQRMVKIYRPNYLTTAELSRLIEPLLSEDGRHSISSSGRIATPLIQPVPGDRLEEPSEAIVVQDTPEVLGQIDRVLVDVDVPPLQVRIEAKILRVRMSEGLRHGVDLGQLPCQQDSITSFAEGGLRQGRLTCSVPSFIRSVEQIAETSVVASQRIQVLNRHRAEMLIGDRIGYPSAAGGEVRFLDVGTKLVLRPSVSTDGYIRIEIHPEQSSSPAPKRRNPPVSNTAELTTHVMIRDGATVAIAGLIAEQVVANSKPATLIGVLPIVGNSFRQRKQGLQRTELIMLVTPRIVVDEECEAEGRYLEQLHEGRATEFRDANGSFPRQNLAQAHYDRAVCYMQGGNYVKARQQIDASLRQNRTNLPALQLRDQINHVLISQ